MSQILGRVNSSIGELGIWVSLNEATIASSLGSVKGGGG